MDYIRLNITAEGQTEEQFAKGELSKLLVNSNIVVDVRRVKTSRDKRKIYRGGLLDYQKAKSDILQWLKEDNKEGVFFTTMFDLYALPNDFPQFEKSEKIIDPYERVEFLETALESDINDRRFIAYIQLHEFEALVLANPQTLELEYFDRKAEIEHLYSILKQYHNNSELIDSGRTTAPSKRILRLIPEYDKVFVGSLLAGFDIPLLRTQCKHFNDWLIKIEKLNPNK